MIKYITKPFQIFWNIDSSFFTTIERSRKYTSPIARNIIKENHFIPYIYYTNTWYKPFLNLDKRYRDITRPSLEMIENHHDWSMVSGKQNIGNDLFSKIFQSQFLFPKYTCAPSFIYPDSGTTEGFQRYRGRNDRMNRTT